MTKLEAIELLIAEGLTELERKYGDDGSRPLAYHNVEHAYDVMAAAQAIGEQAVVAGKIDQADIPLLRLAACYHDIEHGLEGRANEDESIRILTQKMLEFDAFDEQDIQKVTGMITATIVWFNNGRFTQSATSNYLEQIVADADMASLGKEFEVYWDRATKLSKEAGTNVDRMSKPEKQAFVQGQVAFLANHNFYTDQAKGIYNQKSRNIKKLQKNL